MIVLKSDSFDFLKICDSGQNFRWEPIGLNTTQVISKDKVLIVYDQVDQYFFDCKKEEEEYWVRFFDLNTDYSLFEEKISQKDSFLKKAFSYSKGIRILNQDPWETLCAFIISQRKNITAIRSSIEKLSRYLGTPISSGVYAFPTPNQILSAKEEVLKSCGLGYRLDYLKSAAAALMYNPNILEDIKDLKDEDLLFKLQEFYGVGVKVATCVMLFGYHRLNAFPIDVWMDRALKEHYPKGFPFKRYFPHNGIYQQYIFYYYRNLKENGKN